MTLLPLTDCCLLLGVDPKTLRLWLTAAHIPWTAHPNDARLKCLTQPQLAHLAHLHGRFLPDPLPASAPLAPPAEPPVTTACASSPPDADLRRLFTHLQTQIATLQEQVTHLALTLLREREWRWEAGLSYPQAPLPSSATNTPVARRSRPSPLNEPAPKPAATESSPTRPRSRSRALPLIEYGADGSYLAICPTQGVLSLTPDSPEWFDWLASLTAFTFQGANGRFSTTRKMRQGQRVQAWSAYRSLHGRSCTLYLGVTRHLTLAHLEEMATTIYARLTTS
ncbi:MAG: hypothetical protein IVW51_19005 [Thermaceae bacterium]|nr:hypothetical protein [Thermaceae bacterium]